MQGRFQLARECFERSASLDARQPYPVAMLGLAEARLGHLDEALGYLEDARRRGFATIWFFSNLGELEWRKGRLREAAAAYAASLALEPRQPIVNYAAGLLYAQLGDPEKARGYLSEELELVPGEPEASGLLRTIDRAERAPSPRSATATPSP